VEFQVEKTIKSYAIRTSVPELMNILNICQDFNRPKKRVKKMGQDDELSFVCVGVSNNYDSHWISSRFSVRITKVSELGQDTIIH
jgi:gamma-glutamylcysteine synthetase